LPARALRSYRSDANAGITSRPDVHVHWKVPPLQDPALVIDGGIEGAQALADLEPADDAAGEAFGDPAVAIRRESLRLAKERSVPLCEPEVRDDLVAAETKERRKRDPRGRLNR
jgi:hypothetical protein